MRTSTSFSRRVSRGGSGAAGAAGRSSSSCTSSLKYFLPAHTRLMASASSSGEAFLST